jgi:hypothetical protein
MAQSVVVVEGLDAIEDWVKGIDITRQVATGRPRPAVRNFLRRASTAARLDAGTSFWKLGCGTALGNRRLAVLAKCRPAADVMPACSRYKDHGMRLDKEPQEPATAELRAQLYRDRADENIRLAEQAVIPPVRSCYLKIAAHYRWLAEAEERTAAPGG